VRLVITEKPKVARALAKVLGLAPGNLGWFEGTDSEGRPVMIAWALGHLAEMAEPEAHNPAWGKGSRWEVLPFFPERVKLQPARNGQELLASLTGLIQRPDVNELVNAMDAGRNVSTTLRQKAA